MAKVRQSGAAERAMTTLRMTSELRGRIEEAARASGRSISQEVEHRLERSFMEDDVLGGSATAELLRALAAIIRAIERRFGAEWQESDAAYVLVARAAQRLFGALRPDMDEQQAYTLATLSLHLSDAEGLRGGHLVDLGTGQPAAEATSAAHIQRTLDLIAAVDEAAEAAAQAAKTKRGAG